MAENNEVSQAEVVLLSLDKQPWFDEMYQSLLTELKAKANVTEVTTATSARDIFNRSGGPSVVISTDGAMAKKKFHHLTTEAARFVQDGGTLIFGLHFPSFTKPSDIKKLFGSLSLPWESGSYHREDFSINGAVQQLDTSGLVQRYSQKALHLKNVDRQSAVYLESSSSQAGDLVETPAVFQSCGRGKIGYLGDVNAKEGTNKVVLAMCGLLG